SRDFIRILSSMHVGLFYELSFDKSKSEQIINSMGRLITFNFDNFATANIINLQFDDSLINSSTFKDLFGHVIRPKTLLLNESFRNLKIAFLTESKPLNVQEILNENSIKISNVTNKTPNKLISL